MSINPINFLDHCIDDAERFRESGERLAAVILPIPALAHGISCISLLGMIQNPTTRDRHGSAQSSTTERKVRWVTGWAALMVVIDLCEAFLDRRGRRVRMLPSTSRF